MPCNDGRVTNIYSYSDLQNAREEGFENGQKEAAAKLESQIKSVTEKASLLAEKYNQLAPLLCTLLRALARERKTNVATVIASLGLTNPDVAKALGLFWEEHNTQDIARIKSEMSSWDLVDKEIALSLLKKELDVD